MPLESLELLVISATAEEAAPTLAVLAKHGLTFAAHVCGIGPLAAAKASLSLKTAAQGKRVLYLGSAGCFQAFAEPYLVSVGRVWWLPTGERMGYAKHMPALYPPLDLAPSEWLDLPLCQLLTATSVSLNAAFAGNLADSDPGLFAGKTPFIENMEAYAILSELLPVASRLEVVMGITNAVGPEGSEQWLKNWKKVAHLTAEYVEARLCL